MLMYRRQMPDEHAGGVLARDLLAVLQGRRR
jgi:hypothetical protein